MPTLEEIERQVASATAAKDEAEAKLKAANDRVNRLEMEQEISDALAKRVPSDAVAALTHSIAARCSRENGTIHGFGAATADAVVIAFLDREGAFLRPRAGAGSAGGGGGAATGGWDIRRALRPTEDGGRHMEEWKQKDPRGFEAAFKEHLEQVALENRKTFSGRSPL